MPTSSRIIQEYTDCLKNKVFTISRRGGLGLTNPRKMHNRMRFPDQCYKTIHVAGTNGKGSVCTKVARALEYSGVNVGLFLSPHINSIRERISVNSEMISQREFIDIVDYMWTLEDMEDKMTMSFFELMFFAAIEHFKRQNVDVAVVEVGLGGRLDATNVINPSISVITNISLDHTKFLGDTVEEIAWEKAGIIKSKVPVVIGPGTPISIIEEVAQLHGATIHIVAQSENPADYDSENASLSKRVIELFSEIHPEQLPDPNLDAVRNGLSRKPPCRMESQILSMPWLPKCNNTFNVVFDVAHNSAGIQAFFHSLGRNYPNKKCRVVFGMCADKAVDLALDLVREHASSVHFVKAYSSGRGALTSVLLNDFKQMDGVKRSEGNVHAQVDEGQEGFTAEVQRAAYLAAFSSEDEKEKEILCIVGSFFVVADARIALMMDVTVDPDVEKDFLTRNLEDLVPVRDKSIQI